MEEQVKVKLLKACEVKGVQYNVGAEVMVDASSVNWLVADGIAEKVSPGSGSTKAFGKT